MDVAAKLAEAQVLRIAIVDDDLAETISSDDLESVDAQIPALLNDESDPDREAYVKLLEREGRILAEIVDLAVPLSEPAIRAAAPARLRQVAEAALQARKDRAEPLRLIRELLEGLGIQSANIDTFSSPSIPHEKYYDLIIVDYFLVDTSTDATLPFIRAAIDAHQGQPRPLQAILMSSHDERLRSDFRAIRPEIGVSSSRLRIMQKPRTDIHLTSWKAALFQLASDRASIGPLERFIGDTGQALIRTAQDLSKKLWELDLQAMDLLHELASSDHDDYVRYVEDTISRRMLSVLESDGGMRASLQSLDTLLAQHRDAKLLSPTAEIGDSRAAIHGLMHSMEWRSGATALPPFPPEAEELNRSKWIRKHIRFGMVLRDPQGTEWLNLTQACDLAQAKDDDIARTSVIFIKGQHSLPAAEPEGQYFETMSAMMAQVDDHVLSWNLRDIRTESIKDFSATYATGWQAVGELRPDVAQNIAVRFGSRAARVGLPVTLKAWHLAGTAVRVADLRAMGDATNVVGTALTGHAILRAEASKHELHLDRASLDQLLTTHGAALNDSVLELLTGVKMKKGAKSKLDARPVILYCKTKPANAGELKAQFENDNWLNDVGNNDRILVVVWAGP